MHSLQRFLALVLVLCAGCTEPAAAPSAADPHQITQISIINALMLGQYDGTVTIGELLHSGNFGLGTCDHLDGELIVLDGVAWQARSDGTVVRLDPQVTTPFAIVTPFEPAGRIVCGSPGCLEELEAHLDSSLPDQNLFVAIRLEGDFADIRLRSVPRQEPPFKPLAEVAKSQTEWTLKDVKGTLLGIRSPKWVDRLSVPGYHWHFLSADHRHGGHVLGCELRRGEVQYDLCRNWEIKLDPAAGRGKQDLGADLSKELDAVERQRKE